MSGSVTSVSNVSSVSIKLTERCNLVCGMCWQTQRRLANGYDRYELTFPELCQVIDDVRVYGAPVFLWGGEPLLRDCAVDIVRHVKRRRLVCFLVTNGTVLPRYAEALVEARLDFLVVSIDGNAAIHDKIRGVPGGFAKAVDGIRRVNERKAYRPVVSINLVIGEANHAVLYSIVKELSELPIQHLQLQLPLFFPEPYGSRHGEAIQALFGQDRQFWRSFIAPVPAVDVETLTHELARIRQDFPKVELFPHRGDPATWFAAKPRPVEGMCGTAWEKINVEANGDVITCPDNPDTVVGNVREQPVCEIWQGARVKRVREYLKQSGGYPACGFCTYAYLEHGARKSGKPTGLPVAALRDARGSAS